MVYSLDKVDFIHYLGLYVRLSNVHESKGKGLLIDMQIFVQYTLNAKLLYKLSKILYISSIISQSNVKL